MQTALATLSQNWLENTSIQTAANTGGYVPTTTTGVETCYNSNAFYWPYYGQTYYVTSPARPIKLSMAEVERLRKAARADKALKTVLEKFTSQIEVTVQFD